MLWFLLAVGSIGVLSGLIFTLSEMIPSKKDWYRVRGFTVMMLVGIGMGLVGFFGLAGIDRLSYEEVSETGNWELMAIADDVRTSGEGSGGLFYVNMSIDTDEIYSFYYKVDDGGFKRGTVKADSTVIYEKDDCTPHIVEYTTYTKNKMNGILRGILAFGYGESEQKNYGIYTPKGTILMAYTLDNTQ